MKIDLSRFDHEQQQAINAPLHKSVIVSASAGSGKTGVLVNRIVRLCVEDHIDITRILALTFTEAAAAEMKGRIASLLNHLYEETNDVNDRDWLHQQLVQLPAANFTTIDSFCLSLVQKYYNVLGLDPAVCQNVVMGGKDELIRRQAYHLAVNDSFQQSIEDTKLLFEWLSPQSFDFDTVYSQYVKPVSNSANAAIDPERWYEDALSNWKAVSRFEDYPEKVQTWFWKRMRSIVPDLIIAMQENADNASVTKTYTAEKAAAFLACKEKIDHGYAIKDYRELSEGIMELDDIRASQSKGAMESRKRITACRKELQDYIWPEDVLVSCSRQQETVMRTLINLIRSYDRHYAEIKLDKKCITFSDMERFAFNILRQDYNKDVVISIQNSFDEILVDEFQDTSPLQNAVIDLLSHDYNTFRVGDIKQSIYRFRNASPQLMVDLMHQAEEDPDHYAHITLKHNYRSKKDIVNFANTVFARLMTPAAYSTPFRDDDVSLTGENTSQDTDSTPVTYLYYNAQEEDEKINEEERMKRRCALIASKILTIKKEKPETGWHEFAVLVRSRKDMKPLRDAFDQYGIPYDINAREGFYASDLCLFISALIRAILDPQDDISLYALLTSEIFHYSDDQLADEMNQLTHAFQVIHASHGKASLEALGKILHLNMTGNEEVNRPSIHLLVRLFHPDVFETLNHLKKEADINGIESFLQTLSALHCRPEEGQPELFYERLDKQSRFNFDYLIHTYESGDTNNLITLLAEIDAGSDERSSEAVSIGKDDDVVQTATIHGSKGLQYGYTFLLSKYGTKGGASSTVIDPELKFAIDGVDLKYGLRFPSLFGTMIKEKNAVQDAEESMRLFYVAVTRAVKQLYIVDIVPPEESAPSFLKQEDLVDMNGRYTRMLFQGVRTDDISFQTEEFKPFEPEEIEENTHDHNPVHNQIPAESLGDLISPSSLEDENSPVNRTDSVPLRLPDLSFGEETGTDYGTMMHRLCEILPDHVPWSKELIRSAAEKDRSGYVSDLSCARLIAFHQSDLYRYCEKMEIHHEYGFYVRDPERKIRINGSMDFVAISDNQIILIDFKTDKDENDAAYIKKYSGQLNAYRRVLNMMYQDVPCEAWIWSFHNSRAIPVPSADAA